MSKKHASGHRPQSRLVSKLRVKVTAMRFTHAVAYAALLYSIACLFVWIPFATGHRTPATIRAPLQEPGWHLVAHLMEGGGMFSGDSDLRSDFSFGTFTWYPTPSTPDFEVPFPVDAKEIMFVTGDGSVWAITDYPTLRKLIDDRAGDTGENISFMISIDGVISRTVGNVLSRHDVKEDPIISLEGDHSSAIETGRIIWGEVNWKSRKSRLFLKNSREGINVFVNDRLHRDPLRENGWHLIAHMSNQGGMFAGSGNLLSNYSFGTPTWYPIATTSDFQVEFPVMAKEIMFVTGDASVWAITDYATLRNIIDRQGGETNENISFLISINGEISWAVGNVLSRPGVEQDPIISLYGGPSDGIRSGLIVWAERNWRRDDTGDAQNLLKNDHDGMNVYVRERVTQIPSTRPTNMPAPMPHFLPTPAPSWSEPPSGAEAPSSSPFKTLTPRGGNGTIISYPGPSVTPVPTMSPASPPIGMGDDDSPDYYDDDDTVIDDDGYPPLGETTENPTSMPSSFSPTSPPSRSPIDASTEQPTVAAIPRSPGTNQTYILHEYALHLRNVSMVFRDCSPLQSESLQAWQNITVRHLMEQLGELHRNISDLRVELLSLSQTPPVKVVKNRGSGMRNLQSRISELVLKFDVKVMFRSASSHWNDGNRFIRDAVNGLLIHEDEYLEDLRSSDFALANMTDVHVWINTHSVEKEAGVRNPSQPLPQNPSLAPPVSGELSETHKIVLAVLGSVFGVLCLVLVAGLMSRGSSRRKHKKEPFKDLDDLSNMSPFHESPVRVKKFIEMNPQDEVSTLGEPGCPMTSETESEEKDEREDALFDSVGSVDYDYYRTYGALGLPSASSVGGTLGEGTTVRAAESLASGTLPENETIFSDDVSFEAQYSRPSSPIREEEIIDFFVPPGQLGVVIDTPDDGAPVFYTVKDSSCVHNKILVGDKLIAVDDEDVRGMTAMKVSKIIARRSSKPTRKLTILRTSVAR